VTKHQGVRVDSGKYEFIAHRGGPIAIERYGEPWLTMHDGTKALVSIMCELDAARVVLEAARQLGDAAPIEIKRALEQHRALVGDREPPSKWTKLVRGDCRCARAFATDGVCSKCGGIVSG
jgi:hypothetical protein